MILIGKKIGGKDDDETSPAKASPGHAHRKDLVIEDIEMSTIETE